MGKRCFKCGEVRPLTDFYKHRAMADGHLGKCKSCTKLDVRQNYRANKEHYRRYDRSRLRDPKRVEARMAYQKSGQFDRSANHELSNAIRDGRIQKAERCECCGSSNAIEGHHEDYSKPLDVVWLCRSCHRKYHSIRRTMERKGILHPLSVTRKEGAQA